MNHSPELSYMRLIGLFLGLTAMEMLIHFIFSLLSLGFHNLGLEKVTAYFSIISSLVFLYILLEWFCRRKGFKLRVTYVPKAREVFALISLLLGYDLIYGNTIGLLLTNVKEAAWMVEVMEEMLNYPVKLVLGIVVIGPILEEIMYRGIFLEYLARKYGNLKALFVTSFLFGLIHLNCHQGIYAFFMGLLMGWVYLKTRNLLHTLAIHMVQNGLAVTVMLTSKDIAVDATENIFEVSTLLFGVLLFWLGYLFVKNYKDEEYEHLKWNARLERYVDVKKPSGV